MFRRLTAIEIAEGALLADIAVVFQLLVHYLPIGGIYFALLVPAVFTILVLRRGFYASVMSLCVALFIIGILTNPGHIQLMFLEAGAGIFLGLTLKYRLHYLLLTLLGATGSAILFFSFTLLNILILGKPFLNGLLFGIRQAYNGLFAALNVITPQIGLGGWWQSTSPLAHQLADLTLRYWLLLLFVSYWLLLIPVVIAVSYITTFLVRLLGYNVRPFPDGRINKLLQWFMRLLIRLALKVGLGRFWPVRMVIKEVRRQSMGLNRQKVTP